MLIDIGANLTSSRFSGDLDQVISRAQAAAVSAIIVTGTNEAHSEAAYQLTLRHPAYLYSTAGMHPHHAKDWQQDSQQQLEAILQRKTVVAVGECGLDFNRNFSPAADQEYCFEAQLELASSLGLPVFLHQRDAHDSFLKILAKYRSDLAAAVVHCFTGTEQELKAYMELDCHIGITGWICDQRRGIHLHNFVHLIPDSRLLVETDAPFLIPQTIKDKPKNKRNEPMYLPFVIEKLAQARSQSRDKLNDITTKNAVNFFRLPNPAK